MKRSDGRELIDFPYVPVALRRGACGGALRRPNLWIIAVATIAVAGCSAPATGPRGSPDRITRQQLESLEVVSAYDAIQRLRPTWLQTRGPTSISGGVAVPRVHINDSRTADLQELRSLPTTAVESMQFFSAADATTLYGTGYPGGLIEVRTRR
jgi:hypothetical protein